MNWQIGLMGAVMLAVVGTAAAPLAAVVRVAGVAANGNPPAKGMVAANHDASVANKATSDGTPGSTVPGPESLPCSARSNAALGCDDTMASQMRPDHGFVDHALGDLYGNQGAPGSSDGRNSNGHQMLQPFAGGQDRNQGEAGSPYARDSSGYPVTQPSADDQPAGWTRNTGGGTGPEPFGTPQSTQWPVALGANPPPTPVAYSILDAPKGDPEQGGNQNPGDGVKLGIDPGSLPAPTGPTTIDKPPCAPACDDNAGVTGGSPSAIEEPETLCLIVLAILLLVGLRRWAPVHIVK